MIGDHWGVSPEEVARSYPCDDIVPSPTLSAWRGVTVRAAPTAIWPWIAQIRLAPYSYDWIDNLGRRSPSSLVDLPPPRVGEPFTSTGGRPQGRLLALDPPFALTGTILGAVMSYVIVPVSAAESRLLLKIVLRRGRLIAPLVSVGDLVMARKQLLNIRSLAERSAT